MRYEKKQAGKAKGAKIYQITSKVVKRKREHQNLGNKRPLPKSRIQALQEAIEKLKGLKPTKEENKKKVAFKLTKLSKKLRFRQKQRKLRKERKRPEYAI